MEGVGGGGRHLAHPNVQKLCTQFGIIIIYGPCQTSLITVMWLLKTAAMFGVMKAFFPAAPRSLPSLRPSLNLSAVLLTADNRNQIRLIAARQVA